MGYIKEPYGVNLLVDNRPVTAEDRKMISELIAYYKATGKKKAVTKTARRMRSKKEKEERTS